MREPEHIPERSLVLGQGKLGDGAPVATHGGRIVPARSGNLAESGLRMDIAREAHQRLAVTPCRGGEATGVEIEIAELYQRPGGRFPGPGARLDGELHRRNRGLWPPEQLARVRHACVGLRDTISSKRAKACR